MAQMALQRRPLRRLRRDNFISLAQMAWQRWLSPNGLGPIHIFSAENIAAIAFAGMAQICIHIDRTDGLAAMTPWPKVVHSDGAEAHSHCWHRWVGSDGCCGGIPTPAQRRGPLGMEDMLGKARATACDYEAQVRQECQAQLTAQCDVPLTASEW